jgi:hypothetical protein
MAIKQRGTPLDAILLKVIYPLLFRSRLRKPLHRLQLWHREVPIKTAPSAVLNLAPKMPAQEALQPEPARTLSERRAA